MGKRGGRFDLLLVGGWRLVGTEVISWDEVMK
jgi:hypothetical protein